MSAITKQESYGNNELFSEEVGVGSPAQFRRLVNFLRQNELTDLLLTGPDWLHISWNPFGKPRHCVCIGYYK